MSFNTPVYTQGSGTASLSQFVPVQHGRAPASTDVTGPEGPFKVGQQWVDTTSAAVYYLTALSTQGGSLSATWTLLSSGGGGGVDSLSGNSGSAFPTAGNIAVVGTGSVSVSAAGSTLTISDTSPAAVETLTGNSGGPLSPTAGNINVVGSGLVSVAGSGSTLTITTSAGTGDVSTLTGNTGGPVAPTAGNINVVGTGTISVAGSGSSLTISSSAGPTLYPITPYVVGPIGAAGYQTVQSAINAANTAGGGDVYIQPGTYTEDLTLFANVNLFGVSNELSNPAIITGTHTPPTGSGTFSFQDLVLQGTNSVISTPTAGTTDMILRNVQIDLLNGTNPQAFFMPAWLGKLSFYNCETTSAVTDGFVAAPVTTVNVYDCPNLGKNSNSIFDVEKLIAYNSVFNSGVYIEGDGSFASGCSFVGGGIVLTTPGSMEVVNSYIQAISGAISFNSASAQRTVFSNCVFDSGTPVFFGGGSAPISLGDLVFLNSSTVSLPSAAITWESSTTGNTLINGSQTGSATQVTFGMSPYTVTATDFRICCRSAGGAITVILPSFSDSVVGRNVIIEDADGASLTNHITVNGNSDPIVSGGLSNVTQTISTPYGVMDLTYDTNLRWVSNADSALAKRVPITPYVVSASIGNAYQTIQSAINAASSAGGGSVYIQPGTYNEDLTLATSVNLIGSNLEGREGQFTSPAAVPQINGNVSCTVGSAIVIKGLTFIASSGDTFTIAPASTDASLLDVENCLVVANSGNAFVLNGGSATAVLHLYQSKATGSSNAIHLAGGTSQAVLNDSTVVGSTDGILMEGSLPVCSVANNSVIIGQNAAVNISNSAALVTSRDSTFNSIGSSSAIVFNAAGNVESVNDQMGSSAGSGYFISGTGNLSYANVTLTGSATQIDPAVAVNVLESRPRGIAAASLGASILGIASFDSANFTVNDGFVSLGANIGQDALVGGTKTVSAAQVTAASKIFLSVSTPGGTQGFLSVGTIVPGVSFDINSSNAGDTSTVNWWIASLT